MLLFTWGIEVLIGLLLGARLEAKAFAVLQWFTHLLFVVALVMASVVYHSEHKTQASLILGCALGGATILTLLVRLVFGDSSKWSEHAVT